MGPRVLINGIWYKGLLKAREVFEKWVADGRPGPKPVPPVV